MEKESFSDRKFVATHKLVEELKKEQESLVNIINKNGVPSPKILKEKEERIQRIKKTLSLLESE